MIAHLQQESAQQPHAFHFQINFSKISACNYSHASCASMPLIAIDGKYLSNYFCVCKLFARYAQRNRERLQQCHAPRAAFRQPQVDTRTCNSTHILRTS